MIEGLTESKIRQRRQEIGKRIRQARRQRDVTQEQLAEALGVSRTTMNRVERGRTELTMTQVDRLARALKVSTAYFFV